MNRQQAKRIIESICSDNRISGYTHDFYKYPARFSPIFARQIIENFSNENDLIFDPFMGGGTTLVEANILGRRAVGFDISSLATFITKVKTFRLSNEDIKRIAEWINIIWPKLNLHNCVDRPWEWINEGYQRNLNGRDTWPIRKSIELIISQIQNLSNEKYQDFARCLLLRTAQWAIDGRLKLPSANEFRRQFMKYFLEFSNGSRDFSESVNNYAFFNGDNETNRVRIFNVPSVRVAEYINEPPKLILTSPPYPGVHILYHRWQVHGRKETPAPFWISECKDGHGESFYTMGGRSSLGISKYFEIIKESYSSLYEILDDSSVIVQMVAFSNPEHQFQKYLNTLEKAGLAEIKFSSLSNSIDGRIWRNVPNRKWYTEKNEYLPSSTEVVLFHRRA